MKVGIIGRNQAVEDVAYVLFSVFNVIWATVYLETWKRRGAELAYRWGTLDQRDDLLVEPRPLFTVSFPDDFTNTTHTRPPPPSMYAFLTSLSVCLKSQSKLISLNAVPMLFLLLVFFFFSLLSNVEGHFGNFTCNRKTGANLP